MSNVVCCDACGAAAPKGASWYTIHFSARNLELLATATSAEIQYLGEKSACSRECFDKLVDEWDKSWPKKKKQCAAAGK